MPLTMIAMGLQVVEVALACAMAVAGRAMGHQRHPAVAFPLLAESFGTATHCARL